MSSTATAPATRTLVVERELAHPPEKVWRALTQGALLEEWLLKNDFQPIVGHRFTFRSTPMPPHWDGVIHGEVFTVEANQRLAYGWSSMGLDTTVTWTLTPTGKGVLLRMEQAGFRADEDRNYQGAQYGWNNFLGNLEKLLAK